MKKMFFLCVVGMVSSCVAAKHPTTNVDSVSVYKEPYQPKKEIGNAD